MSIPAQAPGAATCLPNAPNQAAGDASPAIRATRGPPAVACIRKLAKQAIVVGMTADPEPYEAVGCLYREGAIVGPDPSRPEAAYLLEMKGRMTWVLFQARVGLVGKLLNLRWQGPITRPEIGRRVVSQRGLVLPAAWSRKAFSASWSSLPA